MPFVRPADQLARAERVAGAVRFSELVPQKVRWLSPDRIPLGRIILLLSDPDLGKKPPHPCIAVQSPMEHLFRWSLPFSPAYKVARSRSYSACVPMKN